jgi:hypothetical protein
MNLNGYTLKAVKMMETHDGIAYSGNIYYNGKQIGSAYNDGRGGMTDVDLIPKYRDHYPALDEAFVERLFTLNDYEDIYKHNLKKNPNLESMAFVLYKNNCKLDAFMCSKNAKMEGIKGNLERRKPGWEIDSIEIFRSPEDFNIDQDHQPEIYQSDDADENMDEESGMTLSQ